MAFQTTDSTFSNVVDRPGTTQLVGNINDSVLSIVVTDGSKLSATGGIISIDNEQIRFTTVTINTITGITRGIAGTGAASHLSGTDVFATIVAQNFLDAKADLISTQVDTQANEDAIATLIFPDLTDTPAGYIGGDAGKSVVVNGTEDGLIFKVLEQSDITDLVADLSGKQNTSEKDQANGYPGLDASTEILSVQIKSDIARVAALSAYQLLSEKGAISGYAPLDGSSEVPEANLPATALVTTFTGLTDVPNSYVGQAGLAAVVNPGETGLIFSAVSGGGDSDISGGNASTVYLIGQDIDGGAA